MGGITGSYVAQDGTLYLTERAAALGQWSDLLTGEG
jgi:hypothetical protein